MSLRDKYQVVIGLEVHAQLLTKTKAYSSDENIYGAKPNTKISVISLGHPGTLPKSNSKVIEYAVKLGIALNCDIEQHNYFARKNYLYPDLPKGYQISQFELPIVGEGKLSIKIENHTKDVRILRAHLEEDAGKSTLINILAGLVKKSSGTVKVWGFDQDENPRQSRAAIGVMPQELNLDPFFTPGASLDMQAGLYGIPRSQRKTHEILRLIGLEDKADSYSRNLSGGMRRRLLLGKALVHSPQILVLDEPTAGVDIALRQMLWNNVRQLNLDGITVILTTHYLEEAQEMCDQIAIMHKGEIRALDTTANLLSKLDTKTLVVRTDTSAKINLPDGVSLINRSDGNMAFSYSRNSTSPSEILDALRAANIRIIDIQTEQPDLQDVFLDITK